MSTDKSISGEKNEQRTLNGVKCIGFILLLAGFLFPYFKITLGLKSNWEIWELLALVWSLCFVAYYYIEFKSIGEKSDRKIFPLIFLSFLIPIAAIYFLVINHQPWLHILLAYSLSFIYLGLDFVLATFHSDPKERKVYRESFWLADMPSVFTNVVLYSWIMIFGKSTEWEVLSGGIIAAQLTTCNFIFIVTQSGVIRKLWTAEKL